MYAGDQSRTEQKLLRGRGGGGGQACTCTLSGMQRPKQREGNHGRFIHFIYGGQTYLGARTRCRRRAVKLRRSLFVKLTRGGQRATCASGGAGGGIRVVLSSPGHNREVLVRFSLCGLPDHLVDDTNVLQLT